MNKYFYRINLTLNNKKWHKVLLIRQVKSSLEQLQYICNGIKEENEIAIIEKYRSDAKRLTINSLYKIISKDLVIAPLEVTRIIIVTKYKCIITSIIRLCVFLRLI